jgi:uncharacterized Fe-S cluster-containing radical SAM superfamily protein
MTINTKEFSEQLRAKAIDVKNKRILITKFTGSQQEKDLSEPANCNGFGRIRHFKREAFKDWPINPLPIDPVSKALKLANTSLLRAQVFQNSVCNWRCWYCYVPFELLAGNEKYSSWLSSDELIDLYLQEDDAPRMIDLSGGQPDLTPEWIPWTMESLVRKGLESKVYLWSDDNLSNDYFWQYLSKEQIKLIQSYKNYSRVCCFKGFDNESFSFNTGAEGEIFNNQFELFERLLKTGIDLYAYVTLTGSINKDIEQKVKIFVDRLQKIHRNLPLRVVPLKIVEFSPVKSRNNESVSVALEVQKKAIEFWGKEMKNRFGNTYKDISIVDIDIRN